MTINTMIEKNDMNRYARITVFLSAITVMSYYYYGLRALITVLISVAASLLTECICCGVLKKKFDRKDLSPVMSGIILALLMPASVPYEVMAISGVMMVSVFKYAFGGNKNLIFNPAAAAYAFAALTWPSDVLRYPAPQPFGKLSLASTVPDILGRSFTYYADASMGSASYLDIIWGKLTGPMGTSCALVIAICAISMYFFRDIPYNVFFSAIASNVLLFVCYPFAATGWQAVLYSLISGSFLFVLVFMACDRRFTPKQPFAQILYGVIFSVSAFLLRKYSGLENSAVLALLIVCVFTSELDRVDNLLFSGFERLLRFTAAKLRSFGIYLKFKNDSRNNKISNNSKKSGNASEVNVKEEKADE